ncbi:uncharacterized protein PAC_14949 [Phialocephala subalpina]|uniref:Uncharacterized protein n=1 Tax=Phialocephala subalpina TaxID=576137 RepID=A0A1L7XJ29_9HELO|nr:uncharacterized protein PAC_14949 [Phialocephala subalpina]
MLPSPQLPQRTPIDEGLAQTMKHNIATTLRTLFHSIPAPFILSHRSATPTPSSLTTQSPTPPSTFQTSEQQTSHAFARIGNKLATLSNATKHHIYSRQFTRQIDLFTHRLTFMESQFGLAVKDGLGARWIGRNAGTRLMVLERDVDNEAMKFEREERRLRREYLRKGERGPPAYCENERDEVDPPAYEE